MVAAPPDLGTDATVRVSIGHERPRLLSRASGRLGQGQDTHPGAAKGEVRTSETTSPALLLDLYELTMADAYRREAIVDKPASFSLFARTLPAEWGYLVAAGLEDCLAWLEHVRFGDLDLAAIEQLAIFPPEFLQWLAEFRFSGSVRAVLEGTLVFADEPILEVHGSIGECQLAETYLLNQITLQTALATQAARCRHAAKGRDVIDFSLRRAPGMDAGMKVARCSRLVGLNGTSNVAGAIRYSLAASGTMAHSFVQAHIDEMEAFRASAEVFRDSTVLLVDTYDTPAGIERAILVAQEMRARGIELRGIRLDSGDLGQLAALARRQLDAAGFPAMTVFASGGLDEYQIDDLVSRVHAPIDGFGVGSSLAAAGGGRILDAVYKLVSFDGRGVRKTSQGKETWPGDKQLWRDREWSQDVLALAEEPPPGPSHVPLLVTVMEGAQRTDLGHEDLTTSQALFESQFNSLPGAIKRLRDPARYPVRPSETLLRLTGELDGKRPGLAGDTSEKTVASAAEDGQPA